MSVACGEMLQVVNTTGNLFVIISNDEKFYKGEHMHGEMLSVPTLRKDIKLRARVKRRPTDLISSQGLNVTKKISQSVFPKVEVTLKCDTCI